MMGKTHALTGALTFTAGSLAMAPMVSLTLPQLILGAIVCAGAAVLPDIDHPGSGVSRTFGPFTRGFAWTVGKLSGGHRNGTHSFFGTGVFTVLAFSATALHARDVWLAVVGLGLGLMFVAMGYGIGSQDERPKPAYKKPWHGKAAARFSLLVVLALLAAATVAPGLVGAVVFGELVGLVLGAAVRLLKIKGWVDDIAPIPVAYWLAHTDSFDVSFIPYAITLGVLTHIAGDMLTYGGCPLGWPWSQKMMGPQLFKTNSWVELGPITWLCWAALVAASVGQVAALGVLTGG